MFKVFIALILLAVTPALANPLPDFEDYHIPVEVVAKPRLDLRSHPQARSYRTRLRDAVAAGRKFAGHYVVASWGCGTSKQFAFIDTISGKASFGEANDADFPPGCTPPSPGQI